MATLEDRTISIAAVMTSRHIMRATARMERVKNGVSVMAKRNIKVAAKTAAAPKHSVKPARKIVVGKKAKLVEAPAPIVQVAAPTRQGRRSDRLSYSDVPVTYTGLSPYVNKRPSRTVIPVSEFGSKPDVTIHSRTENALKDWKGRFGDRPFQRGNLDAGVLKILGWRGFLRHVDGDPGSDKATFQFTQSAMDYHVA